MEVENAVNQPPDPKRQEREEDIDYGKESKDLMTKLKVTREEVLEYLKKWEGLQFEDQVKEGVKFGITINPMKYVKEERPRLELMEGVEKEDILNEIKLYQELIHFCHAQYIASWDRFREKHDPQWLGCMRKLSKIENIRKKLKNDTADRIVSSYYIIETLDRLPDWDGEKETDTGETTYEDLRNLLDELSELDRRYHLIIDPLEDVSYQGYRILMFLERVVLLKELIEEGELDPSEYVK